VSPPPLLRHFIVVHDLGERSKAREAILSVKILHIPAAQTGGRAGWCVRQDITLGLCGHSRAVPNECCLGRTEGVGDVGGVCFPYVKVFLHISRSGVIFGANTVTYG
jgi:hypothetical protein